MRPGPQWFIYIETLGILSFAVNAMIVGWGRKLSTLGFVRTIIGKRIAHPHLDPQETELPHEL